MKTGPTLDYVSAPRGVTRARRAGAMALLVGGSVLAVVGVAVEGIAFLLCFMMPVDGLPYRKFVVAWAVGTGMILGGCVLCFLAYRVGKEEGLFYKVIAGAGVAEAVLLVPACLAVLHFREGDGGGILMMYGLPPVVLAVVVFMVLPVFRRLEARLTRMAGDVAVRRYFRRSYVHEVYAVGGAAVVVALLILVESGLWWNRLPALVVAGVVCGLAAVQLVANYGARRPGQWWMAVLLIVSVVQVVAVGVLLCVAAGEWRTVVLCGLWVWMGKVLVQLGRAVV